MPMDPELLQVTLPGLLFEYSTTSFMFFQGEARATTSIKPPFGRAATGVYEAGTYSMSLLASGTNTMDPGELPTNV